jgi:hypothetical protein
MTSYISFCNKQTLNIIDDNFKESVLDNLSKKYYIKIKDRTFYVIKKNNIKFIENNSYILSIKSLGALYYLFMTTIDNINYCIYIDKKVKEGHNFPRMLIVNYRFDETIFNDTLLEGELLKNNDNDWLFIITNLLLYKGEIQKNKTIVFRLRTIYDILTNNYTKDDHMEICPLYVKRLFSYHELDTIMKEYIPTLNYKVRGLYFEGLKNQKRDKRNKLQNCNDHLYLFPRNMSFEKSVTKEIDITSYKSEIKKKEEIKKSQVIDMTNKDFITFMIRKTDKSDIYNLYCLDNEEIKKYGIAWINSLKMSKKISKNFKQKDSYNVNCKYSKEMEKWYPLDITEDRIDNIDTIIKYLD